MGIAATIALVTAISTGSVTDSVGVNTHIDFNRYGYQNVPQTIADLNYLGVKHLRDCPGNDADFASWKIVADGTGAKFLAFIGETSPANAQQQLARMATLAAAGVLSGVEGANEWDDAYPIGQGATLALGAALQQQVFATGQQLGLPTVNMSFGAGWVPPLYQGDYGKVGDLSAFTDYGNAHTYPGVGQSVEFSVNRLNGLAKMAAASRPVMTTEIGFNNSQFTDEAATAKLALNVVVDGIRFANKRSYFYALYDDGSGKFGLIHPDGTPKAAGTALHNIMILLADQGAALTDSLAFGVTGATANDNALLMEKSSGVFELALWNEKDAPHAVTVQLGAVAQTINLYDPLTGTTATQTAANSNAFALTLPDHPVIVEIVGAGVTPPPMTPPVVVPPVVPPVALTLSVNRQLGVLGLSVADPWADGHAGTMALNLTVTKGTIAGVDGAGKPLAGSGTPSIRVRDSLAAVNAALAGLTYTSTNVGPDALILDVWDQAGVEATKVVPITVAP
jgi:hypothetical protein